MIKYYKEIKPCFKRKMLCNLFKVDNNKTIALLGYCYELDKTPNIERICELADGMGLIGMDKILQFEFAKDKYKEIDEKEFESVLSNCGSMGVQKLKANK